MATREELVERAADAIWLELGDWLMLAHPNAPSSRDDLLVLARGIGDMLMPEGTVPASRAMLTNAAQAMELSRSDKPDVEFWREQCAETIREILVAYAVPGPLMGKKPWTHEAEDGGAPGG